MAALLDDTRVRAIRPLLPPGCLIEEFPLTDVAAATVQAGRQLAEKIIAGQDDRLLVIVGPCSVHDVKSALEYAHLLREYRDGAQEDLCILLRCYFEKPRTISGWKGMINDPDMTGTFAINRGLRRARGLMLDIANMGLPVGAEFLDTISPQYIADLVSWVAIGARTTESQIHRELASACSMPVGFKNGTNGSVQIALDAIRSAATSHSFLSVTKQGISAIVETAGNADCHIILRGSGSGPNYDKEAVATTAAQLAKVNLGPRVMIDASHGNSQKKHERQIIVIDDVARQLASSETAHKIMGVMIESHLVAGNQSIPASGPATLVYGQSVTDACISWTDTVAVLDTLRKGVQARRLLPKA